MPLCAPSPPPFGYLHTQPLSAAVLGLGIPAPKGTWEPEAQLLHFTDVTRRAAWFAEVPFQGCSVIVEVGAPHQAERSAPGTDCSAH